MRLKTNLVHLEHSVNFFVECVTQTAHAGNERGQCPAKHCESTEAATTWFNDKIPLVPGDGEIKRRSHRASGDCPAEPDSAESWFEAHRDSIEFRQKRGWVLLRSSQAGGEVVVYFRFAKFQWRVPPPNCLFDTVENIGCGWFFRRIKPLDV